MRVSEAQLRAVRQCLRVEGILPPRAAVFAMFALGEADESQVIASASWTGKPDQGAVSWHLLARTENGLVVVSASANTPWQWKHLPDEAPEGAKLVARYFLLSRIRSVGVTDVRLWDDPYLSVVDLTAHHSWVLTVDGEPPIVINPDGSEATSERHRAFFEELRSAL